MPLIPTFILTVLDPGPKEVFGMDPIASRYAEVQRSIVPVGATNRDQRRYLFGPRWWYHLELTNPLVLVGGTNPDQRALYGLVQR